jgi:hypothetical protein
MPITFVGETTEGAAGHDVLPRGRLQNTTAWINMEVGLSEVKYHAVQNRTRCLNERIGD